VLSAQVSKHKAQSTKYMHLEIITPDQKIFAGEVLAANFPGSAGAFEVEKDHAPLISTLEKGNITIRGAGGAADKNIMIEGGLVEVLHNKVIVLAESVL
jgi:F-type H+-transporting ATPase subunit epsilon